MTHAVRAALAALALSLVTAGSLAAQQPGPKLAYIRSQDILAQAPGRAQADSQFQREMATFRQQVQTMGDSLNAMIAAYDKQSAALSASAKATRQTQIRTTQAQYQQRVQALQQQAAAREQQLMQPIMERINQVIEAVRADQGYAMVFDAGNSAGVVVAADSSLDITDQVITRLKALPAPPRTPATGAAPKPATGGPVSSPSGVSRPQGTPGGR